MACILSKPKMFIPCILFHHIFFPFSQPMICFLCSKIKKNDGSLPLKLTETYLFCTWGMILENHFFQVSTEWCSIGHGHKGHLIFRRTSTCYTLQCLKQFFLQKVFWVSNNVSVGWQFKFTMNTCTRTISLFLTAFLRKSLYHIRKNTEIILAVTL